MRRVHYAYYQQQCHNTDVQHRLALNGYYGQPLITRPNAIKRLLSNLIDNALKYAEDVAIGVWQDASQLHIAVLDRSPGIPEHELEKVLQPFYRLEASRNRHTGGTGLGLAIAYQLSLALQAELKLLNRVDGGLEARLSLRLSN